MGFSSLYNFIPGNKRNRLINANVNSRGSNNIPQESTALVLITSRKQIGLLALREPIATDKILGM